MLACAASVVDDGVCVGRAQHVPLWSDPGSIYATVCINRVGLDLCWRALRPSGSWHAHVSIYAGTRCAPPDRGVGMAGCNRVQYWLRAFFYQHIDK